MKLILKLSVVAALILLSIIFLGSCSEDGSSGIAGTHDYNNREFIITVHVYDSEAQLNESLADLFPNEPRDERLGFAKWIVNTDMSRMYGCNLYVVKPRHANDNEQLETWGHELAHCVYGTFHAE
jgi:hypothetical protein